MIEEDVTLSKKADALIRIGFLLVAKEVGFLTDHCLGACPLNHYPELLTHDKLVSIDHQGLIPVSGTLSSLKN